MDDQKVNKKYKRIILSVIVSVYNIKNFLNDCLKSLAEQKNIEVEFVVVDDGSTDGSSDICDQWRLRDKRFVIIHHDKNKGLFLARETGILESKGEHIIFLDGDDLLAKGALQKILQLIEKSNADIIQFSSTPFNSINKIQYRKFKNYLYNGKKNIISGINIAKSIFVDKDIKWTLWNKIYNSKILKKTCKGICNYKCVIGEDIYRMFLICYYANTFCSYKTKTLYFYRLNTGISTKKQNLHTFKSYMQHKKIVYDIFNFLQSENASSEWYDCLYSVREHFYSEFISIIARLTYKEFQCAFQSFYKRYSLVSYLPWIESNFIERQNELATAYSSLQQNRISHVVDKGALPGKKTIGIFYRRYYNGGIERVISLQIKLFIQLGYRIVFFTEEINEKLEYSLPKNVQRIQLPISYTQKRAENFLSAIKKYNISTLCHHGTSSKRLLFDIILLRELGVRIFLTAHEMTCYYFAQNKKFPFDRISVYKLADILLTLSSSENIFYKACGVNAYYMQNPIMNIQRTDITPVSLRKPIVLWCGRLSNEKNFKEALRIFKILVNKENNITCYIVGSGSVKNNLYVSLFIHFYRLGGKVIHVPYTKNVEIFYKKASVHLVTSSFESFPMVVAEGKLYGLPLVSYELPNVELLKDGKGYVCITPHNIQDAAESILKIINNKEYALYLSNEARESIEKFLNFDLYKAWSEILENPIKQYTMITEKDKKNLCLFWNTALSLYHEGLSSRPDKKQQLKQLLINIRASIKTQLFPVIPLGKRQRDILLKIYHYMKTILKL